MQEINLYDLLKFYAKKWWLIVILTAIGLASGYVYNEYIQVPMYKSGATLILIRTNDKTSVQDVTQINNYKELFVSRRVLEPVIKNLNLNKSYEELVSSIETTNDKDTEVIKMSVSTNNPKTSKLVVDEAVSSFKKQVKALYVIDNVQVIDDAYLSTVPYNVHKETTLALSAVAGFIVSVIALFFIYDFQMSNKGNLDTKEPKVKKIKVKKFKKLSAISRSLVSMISQQIKASSLKRQTAKLVRAKKAKLVKAEKAKKAELAKIKKNEKAELAKQEKANKLELSKVEKAKKIKQAKVKKAKQIIEKAKKLKLAQIEIAEKAEQAKAIKAKKIRRAKTKKAKQIKARKAANKIRLQSLKNKFSKVTNDLINSIKKSLEPSAKKKAEVKSKKKYKQKKAQQKLKAEKIAQKAKVTDKLSSKPTRGVFYSRIALNGAAIYTNNLRTIKRHLKNEEPIKVVKQEELVFAEPKSDSPVFEPKHGKGVTIESKMPASHAWTRQSTRINANRKLRGPSPLSSFKNRIFKRNSKKCIKNT